MKDKITRLAKGITEIEAPEMYIIPESFDGIVYAGETAELALEIRSDNGVAVRGACYLDDPRMSVDTAAFSGRRCHISFRLSAKGAAVPGEILEGSIGLVTNAGELRIPYRYTVSERAVKQAQAASLPEEIRECRLKAEYSSDAHKDAVLQQAVEALTAVLTDPFTEDEELFEETIGMLIREQAEGILAYTFFKEAIRRGLNVNKLYESFLYSCPDRLDEMMPKEVLLYFSYERLRDTELCRKLYYNVLRFVDRESEIFRVYAYDIDAFAAEALLEGRISDELQLIYERTLYPEVIDERMAEILPDILMTRRVTVSDIRCESLIVGYPQLSVGIRVPVRDGIAFAPIYSEDAVLTLQDAEGACPEDAVVLSSVPLFDRPDLLQACEALCTEHPMLLLKTVRETAERGIYSVEDHLLCEKALKTLSLSGAFARKLILVLSADADGGTSWIDSVSQLHLTGEAARAVFTVLMVKEEYRRAFDLIRRLGLEIADAEQLSALAERIAYLEETSLAAGSDSLIRGMFMQVFREGNAADTVVRFLARFYEGLPEDMLSVFREAAARHIEVYELPEKILVSGMYCDVHSVLDAVMPQYIRSGRYNDLVLRAYFAVRCHDYFVKEEDVGEAALFAPLESYLRVAGKADALPLICSIALTAYYAELEDLNEEQAELCQKLIDPLIEKGLVFYYTKKLRKKVRIPLSVCERYYIEYHAEGNEIPSLFMRVVGDTADFRPEEMKRIWDKVYVASVILFMGDRLEYRIMKNVQDRLPVSEGVIRISKFHYQTDDRMNYLNEMTRALEMKDAGALRGYMQKYVELDEMNRILFYPGD